jgi:hypothetical protein
MTSAEAAAAISSSDCVAVGWRNEDREPQILTGKSATQITKKGVESRSYAATIEHFALVSSGINGRDGRLTLLG